MPGSLPTIARRLPRMALNSVDFPTLGLPVITTVGSGSVCGITIYSVACRGKLCCLTDFHHDQGHVVVLGCAGGEAVCFAQEWGNDCCCRLLGMLGDSRYQTCFSPFLILQIHGLADAVGKADEDVAWLQGERSLLVGHVSNGSYDGPSGF